MVTITLALALLLASTTAIAADSQQVVVGLVDGMYIQTGNSWGNVEVRAKSFGPGFCATHVTVGDKTVSIAAPPYAYSGWVIVNSYGGSVSFQISKEDICDTGTVAEVRYWK